MIYLYWYLGLGVAVGLAGWSVHLLKAAKSRAVSTPASGVDSSRRSRFLRAVLNGATRFVLVGGIVVLFWPFILCFLIYAGWRGELTAWEDEREFVVQRQHLQERLSLQEIEMREMVTDPLNAVPELPFGHLHTAWKAFLDVYTDRDELWSFTALWQSPWGTTEHRAGYVFVRNQVPGACFLTVCRPVREDEGS